METSFKFYILEEVKKLLRLPFCKNKYNNMNTSIWSQENLLIYTRPLSLFK